MFAVPLWYLTKKKRYSIGLLVFFAVNNYIGPDIGYVRIRNLGQLLNWQGLMDVGTGAHSYYGWVLFSIVWAPLWYGILQLMERARARRLEGKEDMIIRHNFSDVFTFTVVGGICHHFVDLVTHLAPPYDIRLIGETWCPEDMVNAIIL